MVNKHTIEELREMQSWDLERKIQVTEARILEYAIKLNNQIYVSFSGGKDSTVLLDIVRKIFPDAPAVFCDTGLEYPEIREFVKTIDNVEWIYPVKYNRHTKQYDRTNFKAIINEYGYPLVSKEVSGVISETRRNLEKGKMTKRVQKVLGIGEFAENSFYNYNKWRFLLDAPFKIDNKCCYYLKKSPFHYYEKRTRRKPIMGIMADEGLLRRQQWIRHGCNIFNNKTVSRPMSFWTEQDVLKYIHDFNLPYANKIYGEILQDTKGKYYTTGAQRTGCVFCGFGAHLEKEPNRFQRLRKTHPNLWEYCMRETNRGGLECVNHLNILV